MTHAVHTSTRKEKHVGSVDSAEFNAPLYLPRKFFRRCWRYLSPREKAILPVLLMHLPNIRPGRDRIGELAGQGVRAVTQGLAELKDAGIVQYEQAKSRTSNFLPNVYKLADLADDKALDSILAKLQSRPDTRGTKARKPVVRGRNCAHGRAHVCASTAGANALTNHHQGRKRVSKKESEPTAASVATPAQNRLVRTEELVVAFHDDDGQKKAAEALAVELPDDAAPERVKAYLVKQGVHAGRAYKLAVKVKPAMVRQVVGEAYTHIQKSTKPGAYLAELLAGALARDEADQAEREANRRQAAADALGDVDNHIDDMPDAELVEAGRAAGVAEHDLTAANIRKYSALRAMTARHLWQAALRRHQESSL